MQAHEAVGAVSGDGQVATYVWRGLDSIVPSSVTMPTDTLFADPSTPMATKWPPRIVNCACVARLHVTPMLRQLVMTRNVDDMMNSKK